MSWRWIHSVRDSPDMREMATASETDTPVSGSTGAAASMAGSRCTPPASPAPCLSSQRTCAVPTSSPA